MGFYLNYSVLENMGFVIQEIGENLTFNDLF